MLPGLDMYYVCRSCTNSEELDVVDDLVDGLDDLFLRGVNGLNFLASTSLASMPCSSE